MADQNLAEQNVVSNSICKVEHFGDKVRGVSKEKRESSEQTVENRKMTRQTRIIQSESTESEQTSAKAAKKGGETKCEKTLAQMAHKQNVVAKKGLTNVVFVGHVAQ